MKAGEGRGGQVRAGIWEASRRQARAPLGAPGCFCGVQLAFWMQVSSGCEEPRHHPVSQPPSHASPLSLPHLPPSRSPGPGLLEPYTPYQWPELWGEAAVY